MPSESGKSGLELFRHEIHGSYKIRSESGYSRFWILRVRDLCRYETILTALQLDHRALHLVVSCDLAGDAAWVRIVSYSGDPMSVATTCSGAGPQLLELSVFEQTITVSRCVLNALPFSSGVNAHG